MCFFDIPRRNMKCHLFLERKSKSFFFNTEFNSAICYTRNGVSGEHNFWFGFWITRHLFKAINKFFLFINEFECIVSYFSVWLYYNSSTIYISLFGDYKEVPSTSTIELWDLKRQGYIICFFLWRILIFSYHCISPVASEPCTVNDDCEQTVCSTGLVVCQHPDGGIVAGGGLCTCAAQIDGKRK